MKTTMFYIMMLLALITFSGCEEEDTGTDTGSEASITVAVVGQNGAFLNEATVSIDETSGLTNQEGLVTLDVSLSEESVVRVSQAGFVNQSVVTAVTEVTDLQVVMIPVKEVLSISDIEQAQVIQGSDLNAQITLPANALVDANGQVAEGNVTLNLTPWDITNSDIAAMLGNGQALDAQNERVELISAGMMSVSFYDSEGNYLQLAPNTTAQIQMDLPYNSINNEPLAIGSTIPLWHFDEVQGLWIEEGTGIVVASATSDTGLAVQANVPHFSTWNWDFKWQNAGSVTVNCQNADGSAAVCNVIADVTLTDGSHFTKSNTIPLEGFTVINMPSSGSIVWTASKNGLIGTQTSGTSGNVLITLQAPTTNNFVQCNLNNQPTDCTVTLTTSGNEPLNFSIPASGATITTALENANSITWNARSYNIIEDTTIVYYTGTTTSNPTQAVNVDLDTRVEVGTVANSILVACTNSQNTSAVTCDIAIYGQYEESYGSFQNIPVGQTVVVTFPDDIEVDAYIGFNAYGKDANGFYSGDGYQNIEYTALTNGQTVNIELYPGG